MLRKPLYLLFFLSLFTHFPLFPTLLKGTLVKTPDGLVAIEELNLGDLVIADEEEELLTIPIIAIQENTVDTIYEVKVGEQIIYASENQKLYDPIANDWIFVSNIDAQTTLVDINRRHHTNIVITKIDAYDDLIVYEISLACPHTFFISPACIKTHNAAAFFAAAPHIISRAAAFTAGAVVVANYGPAKVQCSFSSSPPNHRSQNRMYSNVPCTCNCGQKNASKTSNNAAASNNTTTTNDAKTSSNPDASNHTDARSSNKNKDQNSKKNSKSDTNKTTGSGGSGGTNPNDPKDPNLGGAAATVTTAAAAADKAKKNVEKINNMKEFFDTKKFGQQVAKHAEKTTKIRQGQSVYKANKNINKSLLKNDQFYLDNLHKDHLEVFDKRNQFKTALNLDGTVNEAKEVAGQGRRL